MYSELQFCSIGGVRNEETRSTITFCNSHLSHLIILEERKKRLILQILAPMYNANLVF